MSSWFKPESLRGPFLEREIQIFSSCFSHHYHLGVWLLSPQVFGDLELPCSLDVIMNISLIFLSTALTLLFLETQLSSRVGRNTLPLFKRPKSVSNWPETSVQHLRMALMTPRCDPLVLTCRTFYCLTASCLIMKPNLLSDMNCSSCSCTTLLQEWLIQFTLTNSGFCSFCVQQGKKPAKAWGHSG